MLNELLTSFIPEVEDNPHAWAGDKYKSTRNEVITFDSTGTFAYNGEEILSYEWDIGNGNGFVVGGPTFEASKSQTGLHYVTLRVTTASGYDVDTAYWRVTTESFVAGNETEIPIP